MFTWGEGVVVRASSVFGRCRETACSHSEKTPEFSVPKPMYLKHIEGSYTVLISL